MQKEEISEEKILKAAKKVFQLRGYEGARMQEIADEAGINKAMLHYYFRSKDKLFDVIFQDAFNKIIPIIGEIIESDKPLEDKIIYFVDTYIDILIDNPFLPSFVLHEINSGSERIKNIFASGVFLKVDVFARQILNEIRLGHIKPCDPRQLIISILGLCIFPFVGKPLFQAKFLMNDKEYKLFLNERKAFLVDFILQGIRKI